jgi:hypothetical protein
MLKFGAWIRGLCDQMVHAGAKRSDSHFCCVYLIPGFEIRTVTLRQEADAQRPIGWL